MPVDWGQLRMLIADDQRFILSILFHILKELGVKPDNIYQATNGDDATKILSSAAVDLAICDINMGPGNGLHLLRKIRTGQAQVARDLPCIFLTGHADTETVTIAVLLDANGFIVKPVAKKQLAAKIETVLANRRPLPEGKRYHDVNVELSDAVKAAAAMDGHVAAAMQAPAAEDAGAAAAGPTPDGSLCVPCEELHEGDIVAEDIAAADGTVLLKAGAALARGDVKRLVEAKSALKAAYVAVRPRKPG